jgi:hypothetical protein
MSSTALGNLFGGLLVSYMLCGLGYIMYHVFKIARSAVGIEHRVYFFFQMLSNPFWMMFRQEELRWQTREFNSYVSRIERRKYYLIVSSTLIAALPGLLKVLQIFP